MPVAAVKATEHDSYLAEARKTLLWYSSHAWRARVGYQTLEVFQIGTGAFIPLVAAVHWPVAVTAALGSAIAVAGGLRSTFRWQANWIAWSITAAKIQRELSLYRAHAAPYDSHDAGPLLIKTVSDLEVEETAQWASQAQKAGQRVPAQPAASQNQVAPT